MHLSMAFRCLHLDHRARNRWVVRGSRLFSRVSARTSDETKIAGVDEIRTKAAPLQSLAGHASLRLAIISRTRTTTRTRTRRQRTCWVILGSRLLSGCLDDSPQTANARVRVHVCRSGSPPGTRGLTRFYSSASASGSDTWGSYLA